PPPPSTRGITRSIRGSRRRQPPPFDLSSLRPSGGRRLCSRQRPLSHGGRRQGLRNRRGRGRLLGTVFGLSGPGTNAIPLRLRETATSKPAADSRKRSPAIPSTDREENQFPGLPTGLTTHPLEVNDIWKTK